MNAIALDLGFIQIYWYSIMILCGLLVGMFFIIKEAKKQNVSEDFIINLAFYGIIIGIISARIYYVIFNFEDYQNNILEIFEIWNGGLAIHGGLIGGGLFTLFYCKKHKVNINRILDICVVGLIIAQAIGRWGNFFNGEAYGAITTKEGLSYLPEFLQNGMYINGAYREPTFLYESLWNITGFIALLVIRRTRKYLKTGQLTGIYLCWYGFGRFVIESGRIDSLMLGPLRIAQVISIIMVISGIILIIKRNKGSKFENLYRGEKHSEIRF